MQVGTSTPVDDFRSMIRAGADSAAVSSMKAAIQSLVDNSLSDRYGTSLTCTYATPCRPSDVAEAYLTSAVNAADAGC